MSLGKISRLTLVLPIILVVAACSSSGKLNVSKQKSESIPPNRTVSLIVKSDTTGGSQEMVQRLRSELFGRLVSEAVFKHVLHPQDKGDYLTEVHVLNAEKVSQGARILFGVLAGANKLRSTVKLSDTATGRVVTSFDVEGESASHPLSSENGMEDAIREVVSKMIVALQ